MPQVGTPRRATVWSTRSEMSKSSRGIKRICHCERSEAISKHEGGRLLHRLDIKCQDFLAMTIFFGGDKRH